MKLHNKMTRMKLGTQLYFHMKPEKFHRTFIESPCEIVRDKSRKKGKKNHVVDSTTVLHNLVKY
jgi:hypothetical protein